MDAVTRQKQDGRRRSDPMFAYYGYRLGEMAVHLLPRSICYGVGSLVAWFLTTFFTSRFAGLEDNLRHVLPGASAAEIRSCMRRNVHNLTRCWIDVMASRPHDSAIANTSGVNVERLSTALARGQGAIVVSIHFGPWQTGAAAWNDRGGQVAVLAEELRPPRLFERIVAGRKRVGIHVIPIDAVGMRESDPARARQIGATALREVVRVLRSGGTVAVAMDRDMMGRGEVLPFFGEETLIPVGAVDLAIRTGAALVPAVLSRTERGITGTIYPEVSYDPAAPRDEEVRRVSLELLNLFEGIIRSAPDQWHVLDRVWPGKAPSR